MNGEVWYPINTRYISVKDEGGMNSYFPMPFADSARIEFESGVDDHRIFLMADWHRYPDQRMEETRRFCARWRREMPAPRYGEDFLVMDADGPGQLIGFAYGVRLLDDVDRWSHGGGDNIYIDGEGEHPAFLRGIGGEDTFGAGFGGALHEPDTHLYAGMPYYVHEDVKESRPAPRIAGYRFFEHDSIEFRKSIQVRFGSMGNDISATAYWYQEGPVRPYFELPPWPLMVPGTEISAGEYDVPLKSGEWWVCGPFGNTDGGSMAETLPAETDFAPEAVYDGLHEEESPWLNEGSKELGRNTARWAKRPASHGFVDFNHVFRPYKYGTSPTHDGVGLARCVLRTPAPVSARFRVAWDDHLIIRVNDGEPVDLGSQYAFRAHEFDVPLDQGDNVVSVKLSNASNAEPQKVPGSNHGGWAFAFKATAPDGTTLVPSAV